MNFSELQILNPKRKKHGQSSWNEFYSYYAGYPESFAKSILASAELDPRTVILDPWNGSGTTTYVASRMGLPAVGLDLNPVMVIVARSRLLSPSEADSLAPLAAEILRRAGDENVECSKTDPLLWWLEDTTADWIRSIEFALRSTLLGDMTLMPTGTNFDRISSIAATFYVALFDLTKGLVSRFQSSNPTWIRKPKDGEVKSSLPRDEINRRYQKKLKFISEALFAKTDLLSSEPSPASTRVLDSTLPYEVDRPVDFVLTSPPYCTRIDYTAATRLELAVLHPIVDVSTEELSRNMVGSVKISKNRTQIRPSWGKKCIEFLNQVGSHASYASSTYYLKTHTDYFDKIDRSISNISAVLKIGGTAIFVVQDSHYKEIHNDVPSILSDIAGSHSLILKRRDDFEVRTTMSGINRYTRVHNKKTVESVLCFHKTNL